MEVAVSPYDISFTVVRQGARKGQQNGGPAEPVRLAEMVISMSPMHAKAMLPGMFAAVADYEKRFGRIPLTPETEQAFAETFGGRDIK